MKADLRVTLAIVVAIALQIVSALTWAGKAAARIEALETRLESHAPVAERLARLEAQMVAAQSSLDRIETRLDREARR
jgi:hypothetical protein